MIKKRSVKYLAPSILSANFAFLDRDIQACQKGGADFIHMDVMDGHFVPNISFGPVVIKSLRDRTSLPFDTHLMISDPEKYVDVFIAAGSDMITFHVEATKSPLDLINKIKKQGKKAGLSLRPGTHLKEIIPYLKEIDLVLVMTVEPGFGGQDFMESQMGKIQELSTLRQKHGFDYIISVDGGINVQTARICVDAGADMLVAGSFIFKSNPITALADLRNLPL